MADRIAPTVTLLVAVGNELVRRGIVSMFRSVARVSEVWACARTDEALDLVSAHQPDIVLCHTGDVLLQPLVEAANRHDTRVLLMLEGLDLQDVDETLLMRADGFVMQDDATVEVLQDTVERLTSGKPSVPACLARALITRGQTARPGRWAPAIWLTTRECEVLGYLANGLSNKQIARQLTISEHGVKRHVTNLLAKLNAPNRTLAVALALREGLLDGSVRQLGRSSA